MNFRSLPRRAVLLALLCISYATLFGQSLDNCSAIFSTPGLKIVRDNIRMHQSGPAHGDDDVLMLRLRFAVQTRLSEPQLRAALVQFLECTRYPTSSAVFDPSTLRLLNDNDVVLEFWGDVLPGSGGNHEALINYVLVPIRYYDNQAVAGTYTAQLELPRGITPDRIATMLARELEAYVFAALGVKQMRNLKYDDARANLSRAEALLIQAFAKPPDANQKAVLAYIQAQGCEVVKQARADTSHYPRTGALVIIPDAEVKKTCGE